MPWPLRVCSFFFFQLLLLLLLLALLYYLHLRDPMIPCKIPWQTLSVNEQTSRQSKKFHLLFLLPCILSFPPPNKPKWMNNRHRIASHFCEGKRKGMYVCLFTNIYQQKQSRNWERHRRDRVECVRKLLGPVRPQNHHHHRRRRNTLDWLNVCMGAWVLLLSFALIIMASLASSSVLPSSKGLIHRPSSFSFSSTTKTTDNCKKHRPYPPLVGYRHSKNK